jgi:hypothetical protein
LPPTGFREDLAAEEAVLFAAEGGMEEELLVEGLLLPEGDLAIGRE